MPSASEVASLGLVVAGTPGDDPLPSSVLAALHKRQPMLLLSLEVALSHSWLHAWARVPPHPSEAGIEYSEVGVSQLVRVVARQSRVGSMHFEDKYMKVAVDEADCISDWFVSII